MGNRESGFRVLRNTDYSYNLQLGKVAAISMKEGEIKQEKNGKMSQTWDISYDVDGETCKVSMIKTTGRSNSSDEQLLQIMIDYHTHSFEVNNNNNNHIIIPNFIFVEAGLRNRINLYLPFPTATRKWTSTNSPGVVTETMFNIYGFGNKKSLFYTEKKKEKEKEKPYKLTVAHYYANSNIAEEGLRTKIIDVGLSIVVKIGVSDDGHLDFTVEGPVQHPTTALFYMFEQVQRTGKWKPTACPHCADNERQRWQSESEESDGNLTVKTAPRPRYGYSHHHQRQDLRNDGQHIGNAGGAMFHDCRVNLRRINYF